ncbi:EAL domain-containing protein [Thermodesulfovibrio sp. TK110]
MLQIQTEPVTSLNLYSYLTIHFQPIFVAKTGKIFGYEALTRHKFKKINVNNLFEKAKENGSIHLLDMLCRRNALREACKQGLNDYLFINICPETLIHPNHQAGLTDKFAEEFNFPKERIVLEITEQTAIENYEIFIKAVNYYKSRGYKIAIDDFGAGFGGPKLLSLLEPDIVKIDRHFISCLRENSVCKSFVAFTVAVCHQKDIMVVAEGIENQAELLEALQLEVDLLQGYYLGMPASSIRNNGN